MYLYEAAEKYSLVFSLQERQAIKTEKEQEYRAQKQALHELEQQLHQLRNEKVHTSVSLFCKPKGVYFTLH